MRVSIKYPSTKALEGFLNRKKKARYNYSEQAATCGEFPDGYDHDRNEIFLGTGSEVWETAKKALQHWQQFPPGWTSIYPNNTPLQKDQTVAMLFKLFGLWWKNSTRIVYTFDETHRFGFAYGTIEGHVEQGEEIFGLRRTTEGEVYYYIHAFSTPKFWMTRMAYPIARYYQRQFVLDSMQQMKKICSYEPILQYSK